MSELLLCIIKYLDYEAQELSNIKKKRVLKCSDCPVRESCTKTIQLKELT